MNCLGASQGISALHWAAHKEHEDVALFLIENGADISLLDKEGRTPLSMASLELVTKMIGEGRGEEGGGMEEGMRWERMEEGGWRKGRGRGGWRKGRGRGGWRRG